MQIKKNISLILGISIPILMIVFVAAAIYLPGFFIHPQYNFLYSTSSDYYGGQEFTIENGKLVKGEVKRPDGQKTTGETKLFIHDVISEQNREVSLEEARSLELDPYHKSLDGFEVVHEGSGDSFLPFGHSSGDYCSRYLSGHNMSRKLELQLSSSSSCGNFRFIGWVK
ncbi:MAG: hypothetical protein WC911_08725 [Thermoleophilia bacterium]